MVDLATYLLNEYLKMSIDFRFFKKPIIAKCNCRYFYSFEVMILKSLDNFYAAQEEPCKSCLLALSKIILQQDKNITTALKYGMPFFMYKTKMFCYLWVDKKLHEPYLGIVEGALVHHPKLIQGKRARMKTIQFSANKDLPIKTIQLILKQTLDLYRNGTIKTKK